MEERVHATHAEWHAPLQHTHTLAYLGDSFSFPSKGAASDDTLEDRETRPLLFTLPPPLLFCITNRPPPIVLVDVRGPERCDRRFGEDCSRDALPDEDRVSCSCIDIWMALSCIQILSLISGGR